MVGNFRECTIELRRLCIVPPCSVRSDGAWVHVVPSRRRLAMKSLGRNVKPEKRLITVAISESHHWKLASVTLTETPIGKVLMGSNVILTNSLSRTGLSKIGSPRGWKALAYAIVSGRKSRSVRKINRRARPWNKILPELFCRHVGAWMAWGREASTRSLITRGRESVPIPPDGETWRMIRGVRLKDRVDMSDRPHHTAGAFDNP